MSRSSSVRLLTVRLVERLMARFRSIWPKEKPPIEEAPVVAVDRLVTEPVTQPLAVKLRNLESVFLPIAENAAHPREFLDQPSFEDAAALLSGEAVSLKSLMQYVLGANWGLSCAALAALSVRADRVVAKDQVVSAFDRLTPWAMFYAFSYFLTLPERPPIGALFVNAKDWWRENPVIQQVAQEYFDEVQLLGDLPSFGTALNATPATSYPLIRAFLERLNFSSG
jgi:hypothetical protein